MMSVGSRSFHFRGHPGSCQVSFAHRYCIGPQLTPFFFVFCPICPGSLFVRLRDRRASKLGFPETSRVLTCYPEQALSGGSPFEPEPERAALSKRLPSM